MFAGMMTRETLVSCLPEGGTGIEIGVAEGVFSEALLRAAKPRRLHLVDPWLFQDREDYLPDHNNVDGVTQDKRHDHVVAKFAREIEAGRVAVHRGYSADVVPSFKDGTFDWAFVDAMHTRDAVLEDLRLVWPKVKPDGFILGHDFSNAPGARQMGFGVVEGVRAFVEESGAIFAAMTMISENFPSYVLVKRRNEAASDFLKTFLLRSEAVVELRSPFPDYEHKIIQIGDRKILYPSF